MFPTLQLQPSFLTCLKEHQGGHGHFRVLINTGRVQILFFFFLSWKTRPLGHQTPLEVQEKLSSIQLCRVYPKIHWIGKIRGDLALGCSESHESKIYPFNLTVPIPMSTSGKNRDCLSPAEPKTGLGPHFLRRQKYYHPWKGIWKLTQCSGHWRQGSNWMQNSAVPWKSWEEATVEK